MDDRQLDVVASIAVHIATMKAESWTGQLSLAMNATGGMVADMHVQKGQVVRFGKKYSVAGGRGPVTVL